MFIVNPNRIGVLMKKCLTLLMFSSCAIFAADNPYQKMSQEDCTQILSGIGEIEFARSNSMFFAGCTGARSQGAHISRQLDLLKNILGKNSIPFPNSPTCGWLNQLKEDLESKKVVSDDKISDNESDEETASTVCDIAGLNKADVLRVLYQNAGPGDYWLSASKVFSQDEFEQEVIRTLNFGYFGGRPLKVNLEGDTFDSSLYDRDNGQHAARKAIAQLRGLNTKPAKK